MTALTAKAEETRNRILETALKLFQEKGYEETTLRDIAEAAECSLGLIYRYFGRKEDMVMELYERLANELIEHVSGLQPLSLADEFERTMLAAVDRLVPHQDALGALFAAGMNIKSGVAVLGSSTTSIRVKMRNLYRLVIERATNAPRKKQIDGLADIFYGAHLAVILFWLYDRTANKKATGELIHFMRDCLALIRPILGLPLVAAALSRLAKLASGMISLEETQHDQKL